MGEESDDMHLHATLKQGLENEIKTMKEENAEEDDLPSPGGAEGRG